MRVVLHDYGGYPFPAQLARELSRRGHSVLHLSSGSYPTPSSGNARTGEQSARFETGQILLNSPIEKSSLLRRRCQEREYGRRLTARVAVFGPDAVLSANTPLDSQAPLLGFCRREGVRFVNWVQDAYGTAAAQLLRKRLGRPGAIVGSHYLRMEKRQLRESDFVIIISDDFYRITDSAEVPRGRVVAVPNWAPLDEIVVKPKNNPLSRELGLTQSFNFVYTGTLGMKHNPGLLLDLAESLRERLDARVVVVSEGKGADWLRDSARSLQIPGLMVLPFQEPERLPDLLACGDVLVAILESDASEFSVPSKVLTYLCAGRAILLAVPARNLAARTVVEADAGLVVPPCDPVAFLAAANAMYGDSALRHRMSARGRAYAESAFPIARIADAFESVLLGR